MDKISKEELEVQLKETIHKFDLWQRPYIVFCHPSKKEMVENALKEIDVYDKYVLQETVFLEEDKIIVADREQMELPKPDFAISFESDFNYYAHWYVL